jgi:hypothetical protein
MSGIRWVRSKWNGFGPVKYQLLADIGGLPLLVSVPVVTYRFMTPIQILCLGLAFKVSSFVSPAVSGSCFAFRLGEIGTHEPSNRWMQSTALSCFVYSAPASALAAVLAARVSRLPLASLVIPSVLLSYSSAFMGATAAALRFCFRPRKVFLVENSVVWLAPVVSIFLFRTAHSVAIAVSVTSLVILLWPSGSKGPAVSLKAVVPFRLILHKLAQSSCAAIPMLIGLAAIGSSDAVGASQLSAAASLALVPLLLASASAGAVARASHDRKGQEISAPILFIASLLSACLLCIVALPVLDVLTNSTINRGQYRLSIYAILFLSAPQAIMSNRRARLDGAGSPQANTLHSIIYTLSCVTAGLLSFSIHSPQSYFTGVLFSATFVSIYVTLKDRAKNLI